MLNIACTQTIILAARKNVWQEGSGEKEFPVLRDSRSRYVERNDIMMMIYHRASSKFLWSEIFVIHAILPKSKYYYPTIINSQNFKTTYGIWSSMVMMIFVVLLAGFYQLTLNVEALDL